MRMRMRMMMMMVRATSSQAPCLQKARAGADPLAHGRAGLLTTLVMESFLYRNFIRLFGGLPQGLFEAVPEAGTVFLTAVYILFLLRDSKTYPNTTSPSGQRFRSKRTASESLRHLQELAGVPSPQPGMD